MVKASTYLCLLLLRVSTSESRIPGPCFQPLKHHFHSVLLHFCLLPLLFQIAIITYIHPYHLYFTISSPNECTYTSDKCIRCVGDTRETCILIAVLLERDIFDLY